MFSKLLRQSSHFCQVLTQTKGIRSPCFSSPFVFQFSNLRNPLKQRSGGYYRPRKLQEVQHDKNIWSDSIENIFQSEKKLQAFQLKELLLKCENIKRASLVEALTSQAHGDKVLIIFTNQLSAALKTKETNQILNVMKHISLLQDYFFINSPQSCVAFDNWTREYFEKNLILSNNLQLITFTTIYGLLVSVYPSSRYTETAKLINDRIMANQSSLPDNAIISHYVRFKRVFQIKENDIILNNNESELGLILKSIKLLDHDSDRYLLDQLQHHASKWHKLDIEALSVLSSGYYQLNSIIDYKNILDEIRLEKRYLLTAKNAAVLYQALHQIARYLLICQDKQERNNKIEKYTNKCYLNCAEDPVNYTATVLPCTEDYQQSLGSFMQLAQQILQAAPPIEKQIIGSSLIKLQEEKLRLFYQISKIHNPSDISFFNESLEHIVRMQSELKGNSLVNTICLLANYQSLHRKKEQVLAFLNEHQSKILENLKTKSSTDANNSFTLAYCAYLSCEGLQNKELQSSFLNTLENRLAREQTQGIAMNNLHDILAMNYLEFMGKSDSKSQDIFKKLLEQIKLEDIEVEDIKLCIQNIYPDSKRTIEACRQWFQKREKDTFKPKDYSYFQEQFNRLQVIILVL